MNPIISSTGAFTEIVEAKAPKEPNNTEKCPACDKHVEWDDTYYGGCCSAECYQHMVSVYC